MKFDMHTHHNRCGHAIGSIREYIEEAIKNKLDIIGISDHSPFFGESQDQYKPWVAMAKSEFSHYINEVLELKREYQDKINVLVGVESDFFPEHAQLYRNLYKKYPLDYIIGSVHVSNGIDLFNRERWYNISQEQVLYEKEIYYDLIQQSARSGMFDILGHIDALKGFYPSFSDIKTKTIDQTLQVIAECDVVIEVNTSGKTKDCGGWYPADDILERALYYGVKVTFGSDAHHPTRVADDWELVRKFLKELGYNEWFIFLERKRKRIKL
ncbi:histidinol-phosphatase [Bacillus cereus group sp. N21]|uniref:histidinol-phosphatase n=1 Tax=Bacillus cereus group sp. N21 TaxID=2794591 RepID=UPI0018F77AD4|nr:histidinol-phosphatase [Bacillus cereus group sp. N21]MBJ8030415.1 histidinol-phosphatase [Bacillus cereus group sp. N21]